MYSHLTPAAMLAESESERSGFTPEWLALREPIDAVSRAEALAAVVAEAIQGGSSPQSRTTIVDLGAGTGAKLRYAAPRLPGAHDWILVDRDRLVLDAMSGRMRGWAESCGVQMQEDGGDFTLRSPQFECTVQHRALDLANDLASLELPRNAVVSASALLDLVSEAWLSMLVERARDARATVWFTLNYDGRMECFPPEPEDAEVRDLFNAHQLRDKGFGAALGPRAATVVEEILARYNYRTWRAASDWQIGPGEPALQRALIDGWLQAACEMVPDASTRLKLWHARRLIHVAAGRSELRIGHADIVGRFDPRF